MKSPKKYFMILALAGLIPLFIVLIFFIYYLNGRSRQKGGGFQSSPGSPPAQTFSRPPDEWVRAPKSTLEQLAGDSRLVRHLKQIDWSAVKEENSSLVKEQKVISACLERFRDQHPEFEEIALKNPQTGDRYVTVPARALGENFIGVRLVVTIPIRIDANAQAMAPLLVGFIRLDQPDSMDRPRRMDRPRTMDRMDQMDRSDRLVGPSQLNRPAAFAGKGGGATASTMPPTKKMAIILIFFLAFIVISIPTSMFLFYRKIKKVINSKPSNSYSPISRGKRTYHGLRRGEGDHNYHPHPASPATGAPCLKGEENRGCPPLKGEENKGSKK